MSETNSVEEGLGVDFERPDILGPEESEPVELEEVLDWEIPTLPEDLDHGISPEDMDGIEIVEDEE